MEIEGKIWGTTFPLIKTSSIEVHRIHVNEGGYCSKHLHQSKINAFYILKGILEIKRWKDYDLVDITKLGPNQLSVVPAGEYHMFKALTFVDALEIYWTELNHNDIVRKIVGGIISNEEKT